MTFIVLFQQVSMHHIYNDIFHQAAVSQSLIIRINAKSFMFIHGNQLVSMMCKFMEKDEPKVREMLINELKFKSKGCFSPHTELSITVCSNP